MPNCEPGRVFSSIFRSPELITQQFSFACEYQRIMLGSKSLIQQHWKRVRWLQTPALLGVGSLVYLLHESQEDDARIEDEKKHPPWYGASTRIPFPIVHQPRYVECESMFGRMLERRKTLKRLKEGRDKRKLEDVYHVNWEAPLGEGGFGAVFAAANKSTGKFAALKVISKEYTNDDGFRREMEALLQIRGLGGHPNLCGLHENFDEGGKFYLTLDYISGGEMFDHLINSGVRSTLQ